jgi:hypothetical protein
MVDHHGEVPEAIADGPQQHLEEIFEPKELLANAEPHRALSPLARVHQPKQNPFVLEQHAHPDLEQAQRRRPARGSSQCLPEYPVAGLDAEPPSVTVGDLAETHLAEHRVDEVLTAVLAPLPAHLVANHDVDRHLEGSVARPRPLQRMRGRVGALAALPLLPLTGPQAQGDHGGELLRLQPREDGVVVEPAIEEDRLELTTGHAEVVEGRPDGGESAAIPRVEPEGGDEPVVGEEDREGGEAVGAVGAPLLLGLHDLSASRVLGSAIVRSVVEVDGDIDRLRRKAPSDLPSKTESDGLLDATEFEVTEEPSGRSVGVASTALGAGAVDRSSKDGGSEQKVGGIEEGRGAKRPAEGALQEGEEPGKGGLTDLSIDQSPRSPSGPAERRVFLSAASSSGRGLTTAAAAFVPHTPTSAVFLSSTPSSIGRGGGQEPPENSSVHVRRPVANCWPEFTR